MIPKTLNEMLDASIEAENRGDAKYTAVCARSIENRMNKEDRKEVIKRFMEVFLTKKAGSRYRQFLFGVMPKNPIEFMKMITSVLTHSLIEVETTTFEVYNILEVEKQIQLLYEVTIGERSVEDVQDWHRQTFGEFTGI